MTRTWTNDAGLPLSASNLNALETDVQTALGVPDAALATRLAAGAAKTHLDGAYATKTELNAKEPAIPAGTTSQYIRGDKSLALLDKSAVGLNNVNNTADVDKPVSVPQQAAINAAANAVVGVDGTQYRIVACTIRNTGTGFAILNDATHDPVNISSITTAGDDLSVTLNFSFTGVEVAAVVVGADETLASAGYVFGSSVGLSSLTITASQPGGFGDYVSWNGSAWTSLNGYITSTSMDGTSGLVTCNHTSITPVSGSVTSRSLTKRASMEGLGATNTNLYLVDNAGVTVKTPTTDNRFWITRTGARAVKMSELVQANSNIWVYGLLKI